MISYEPEIHPGATYRWKETKATYKIFQTGAITITAPSVAAIDSAVQHIYPLVVPFAKEKPRDANLAHMKKLKREAAALNGDNGQSKVGSKRKSDTNNNGRRKKRKRSDVSDSEGDDEDRLFINDKNEEAAGFTSEEEASLSGSDSD